MSCRVVASVALAVLMFATSCGSPSSAMPSPAKVRCLGIDPSSQSCTCSTTITANDPEQVTSCNAIGVAGVSGCCAALNATQDCFCDAYVCSYVSVNPTGQCDCSWGNSNLTPTDLCTGTHCCQYPNTTQIVSVSYCSCSDMPCASGTAEVTSCPQNSPAFYCPVGWVSVTGCVL